MNRGDTSRGDESRQVVDHRDPFAPQGELALVWRVIFALFALAVLAGVAVVL